ncbi:hypothetical protein TVAG_341320 [Trichomonas vaginalis G3]|uniref:Uncharacterized protein n=1 Tax=Trichomonas vaginalis (strain ATCC PRA-98 / G3) TaxID=412133 RepID=A2DTU1_TRIV3|nr:armadillo (ARM) repeat-containing protein family [Trichomonas vaginalis G3]EAY16238.1 hypothetical protein TVAG_341320 [Trichomonas vaginalis G3]KAI5493257.1 armadillo (ARM) repeat-containing protein family [Trichomonas vaginalis G3]|eukprot:XP_001328461.1 hypothetical protein [Trichomonas vaginalis G3]
MIPKKFDSDEHQVDLAITTKEKDDDSPKDEGIQELTAEEIQKIPGHFLDLLNSIPNSDLETSLQYLDEIYSLSIPQITLNNQILEALIILGTDASFHQQIQLKALYNLAHMFLLDPRLAISLDNQYVVQLFQLMGPNMSKTAKLAITNYIMSAPIVIEKLNQINFINVCIQQFFNDSLNISQLTNLREILDVYISQAPEDDNELGRTFLPLLQKLNESNDPDVFVQLITLLVTILNQCSTPQVFDFIFEQNIDHRCFDLFGNLLTAARLQICELFQIITGKSYYCKQIWERNLLDKLLYLRDCNNELYMSKSIRIWGNIIYLGMDFLKIADENKIIDLAIHILDNGSFKSRKKVLKFFNICCNFINDEYMQQIFIEKKIASFFASFLETPAKSVWPYCLSSLRKIAEFILLNEDTELFDHPLFEGVDSDELYDNLLVVCEDFSDPHDITYENAYYFLSMLEEDHENAIEPSDDSEDS